MTNKEALKAWEQMYAEIDQEDWLFVGTINPKMVSLAIKALENSSWIPVSERLPEKKGYFLTSTVFNDVYCDFWNGEEFERTEMILAWMPLPQPYTKEERT